jgi:hypothetical protein
LVFVNAIKEEGNKAVDAKAADVFKKSLFFIFLKL